jgi:hypothetical protein
MRKRGECWSANRSSYVSGSCKMIYSLHNILKKNIEGLGGSITRIGNAYQLCFAKNDTLRLKEFLYKNITKSTLMLRRKHKIFMEICYEG